MPLKDPLATNPLKPAQKSKASSQNAALLIRRPIATNSRIKQGENLRRDMYLAFVNNALQEQSQGKSGPFNELVNQFSLKPSSNGEPPQTQPGQLRFWILALSHVVSRLERRHSALVEAIVNMPWMTLDSATVKSYTVFIGMLLSARPEYLSLVLSKIVQGFTHQSGIQALDLAMPEGSSKPLTRRLIYDRLHYLLNHILSLIPTLPSTLQPILVRYFPHKRQNQLAQATYIRNLLRISAYCPALTDKILATIIDRAIQIDVEIQVELEELEGEGEDDDLQHDVFEFDPFDVVVGQEGDQFNSDDEDDGEGDDDDFAAEDDFSDLSSEGGEYDEERTDVPTNVKHVQEMVKKLDAILTLMFEHFNRALTQYIPESSSKEQDRDSSPDLSLSTPSSPTISTLTHSTLTPPPTRPTYASRADTLRTTFHALLSIFDRTILSTFKSRYTQFLLFWYTSLDPEFADIFQGMLVDRALFSPSDTGSSSGPSSTAEVNRAAAASYIGSFVSRATFVDREGTRRVVGVLCDYLGAHLDGVDEAIREHGPSWIANTTSAQHTVFYAVTQAVFLIFCFRWRDLQEDLEFDDEVLSTVVGAKVAKDKWIPHLQVLKRVVLSVLNPLKVCSSGVVEQFAKVAQQTDFMYCYSVLESNKRSEYSGANSNGSPSRSMHPSFLRGRLNDELNTFFPFDPYRLPKSNSFIQSVYREWSDVAIDEEDDDDEEEDEDGEGEDSSSDEDGDEEKDEDQDGEEESPVKKSDYLDIPRPKQQQQDDDGGLGESLVAMSISPRVSASVTMGSSPTISMSLS
ncbi:ribosomal DNA transcription factor Rrn3 [Coprinopsis cinerea okayama7|uniref:Ribosomal DNA transcription factor Rrn3 n=1 Tax=Coprinopsis cinerea (strain Okayama-7 / 130 / ATCC MYA-4618 / FGSC 9003) TaxID=240176 RepID=A8NYN5_COPC7|nr:RNA polymerase I-specific transcription initiation factor RRN3 family protein [Coprinopsis cinerea okayama7\|eukprot:XP_001837476.1 RNA polymerase I-specific transcription initiation factor RRN3 family protein [Coprinopsis cinerea okayama7\